LAAAAEQRRLFALLPFSTIAGLAAYATLPSEPSGFHFWTGSIVVTIALLVTFARQNLSGMRWVAQMAAVWLGFCLLPIHGAALGTPMLSFPAYGTYEALVDEVISTSPQGRRVVLSEFSPVEEARPVPVRRARLLLPLEPPLEPGDRILAKLRLAPMPAK
jgi:competence protein ComEC